MKEIADTLTILDDLKAGFRDNLQGRSQYQIEKFVVGSHDGVERKYAQCMLELQHKYFAIRRAACRLRELKRNFHNSSDEIESEKISIDIEELEIAISGSIREFKSLMAILERLPKCSYEDIERAEAAYWKHRLSRQAQQDVDSRGAISSGNLDALRQIDLIGGFNDRFERLLSEYPGKKTTEELQ